MTPLRLLLGTIAIFIATYQANAQEGSIINRPPIYDPNHPGGVVQPEYPIRPGLPIARPERPPRYPEYPNNPPLYPDPGLSSREIFVGRYMQNERLDLNYYLERGVVVESIDVWVNTYYNTYSPIMSLLVDRLTEDSRSVLNARLVQLRPRRPIMVDGFNGRLLQLEVMNGSVFVDRIVVHVRSTGGGGGGYPGTFDLSQYVNRQFIGLNTLDLGHLVNLYAYRGYRVVSVHVRGSSAQGHGRLEVLANSFNQGGTQILPIYSTDLSFFMGSPNRIGMDLNSLVLRMQGNITIERVIVRVAR